MTAAYSCLFWMQRDAFFLRPLSRLSVYRQYIHLVCLPISMTGSLVMYFKSLERARLEPGGQLRGLFSGGDLHHCNETTTTLPSHSLVAWCLVTLELQKKCLQS